ncbi:hypothetical protein K4F52_006591 [Lecanicillium sp. MT-2017a]|nr:hypothetical protein K4F52_006591 [Lecanicillium sp. MT-2017a]
MVNHAASPATSSNSTVVGSPNSSFWLFDAGNGFDLTHPPSPNSPLVAPRLKMQTATAPITIAPHKTALVIIDMQNLFLRFARGPGHDAEGELLTRAIPAARKAGIQIIYVTWGLSDEELSILPPSVIRAFGFQESDGAEPGSGKECRRTAGAGDDLGDFELPDGSTVSAGRLLMRGQWNTEIHGPLLQSFDESQQTALPDVRFHKARVSGFWAGSTACVDYLKQRGITTLLFGGVNTDQCVLASLQDACNLGFDTILLKDACGTTSPKYASDMVEYNCRKSWGFVSSCGALAEGVRGMESPSCSANV